MPWAPVAPMTRIDLLLVFEDISGESFADVDNWIFRRFIRTDNSNAAARLHRLRKNLGIILPEDVAI